MPLTPLAAGERELPEAEARYVARVHRLGPGDGIIVFDPEARAEADAEILSTGRSVKCRIGAVRAATRLPRLRVELWQALGKSDKPESVVRDATALGVARVVFVETARTVVRLADRAESRRKRWRAVAIDAARQSGRGDVPEIQGPIPLGQALALRAKTVDPLPGICLSPTALVGFGAAVAQAAGGGILLFVGPEGGFDAVELEEIGRGGFGFARLGEFVLRTELAAVAALGAILAGSPRDSE